jgi:hypothetical protein
MQSNKLRYDGLYSKLHQSGFYFILRFYEDGTVCSGYVVDPPEKIGKNFNPDRANHGKCSFFIEDNRLTYTIDLPDGSIDYDCVISKNNLKCVIASEITKETMNWDYQFVKF